MNKPYKVTGDKENGYRIAVPTKAKVSDEMHCVIIKRKGLVNLMPGDIVYTPVLEPFKE